LKKHIDDVLKKTTHEIREIYNQKKYFLSEDDFKCILFSILEKNINDINLTKKLSVHSEVSFYGDSKKLKYRPDLSIFKNKHLEFNDKTFDWSISSKGVMAIIEIKFIKKHTKKIFDAIEKDLIKLSMLSESNKNTKMIIFCFDFTSSAYNSKDIPSKENVIFEYIPRN